MKIQVQKEAFRYFKDLSRSYTFCLAIKHLGDPLGYSEFCARNFSNSVYPRLLAMFLRTKIEFNNIDSEKLKLFELSQNQNIHDFNSTGRVI